MTEDNRFGGLNRRTWIYGALVVCIVALACLKPVAVASIRGYQRYLSAYKGYHCAHAFLYGGLSCSEYGKQAIEANGVLGGLILLAQRFEACHEAAVSIRSSRCVATEPRVEECLESDVDRGKREGKEVRQYCGGCIQGCCADL